MTDKRKPAPTLSELMPPSSAERREDEERRWESVIVNEICKRLNVPTAQRGAMRKWAERQSGSADLTLEGFHEVVPEFPIFFGCKLFRNLGKMVSVSKLFMRFASTPMYKEYMKLRADLPVSAGVHRVGFIFKWPNLMRPGESPTGLVLHNRPSPMDLSGTRLSWVLDQSSNPSAKSKETIRLYITPLTLLLSEVVEEEDWEP